MTRALPLVLMALAVGAPAARAQQEAPVDPPVLPGDLIALEVWREEELSGEFLVDQHYRVTLPLVGEIDVRGETELSLRERVRGEMQKSVWNPSIQLFVLKRIRVLGEVTEPGVFNLDGTMRVADALAMAGGRTPLAKTGTVVLRRGETERLSDVTGDQLLSRLLVESGDELLVPRMSWLERNLGAVVTGATGVLSVLVIYLVSK